MPKMSQDLAEGSLLKFPVQNLVDPAAAPGLFLHGTQ